MLEKDVFKSVAQAAQKKKCTGVFPKEVDPTTLWPVQSSILFF